jgi:hypothetical protein
MVIVDRGAGIASVEFDRADGSDDGMESTVEILADDGVRLDVDDAATGCVVIGNGLSLASMFFASFLTSELIPLVLFRISP